MPRFVLKNHYYRSSIDHGTNLRQNLEKKYDAQLRKFTLTEDTLPSVINTLPSVKIQYEQIDEIIVHDK